MNIWIVNHYAIPPSLGGLVRHYYFSKYLQEKGHKVRIFTSSKIHNTNVNMIQNHALFKEKLVDDIEYTFVKSRNYSGNGLDRILNMIDLPFKMNKTMNKFLEKETPDVIYTSSPDLFVAFFALKFAKRKKVPIVTEVRDLWPESIVAYNNFTNNNIIIKILYQLEKWLYKKSDRLIFTMAGGVDYIMDQGWGKDIDISKVNHVNNGVDLKEFDSNREFYQIDDEDLTRIDCFKVIYTGSIRHANGVGQIVDVAELLQKQGNQHIKFLIYGDGNEKEQLERLCMEKKLENIIFKGKVEKKYIPYILSQGNLNFMHGRTTHIMKYGLSFNKLFDYMASEIPIISDLDNNYDLIKEHHLGQVVNNPTVASIAECIAEIAECSAQEYEIMKSNNRALKQQYDYRILTDKLEKILKF